MNLQEQSHHLKGLLMGLRALWAEGEVRAIVHEKQFSVSGELTIRFPELPTARHLVAAWEKQVTLVGGALAEIKPDANARIVCRYSLKVKQPLAID